MIIRINSHQIYYFLLWLGFLQIIETLSNIGCNIKAKIKYTKQNHLKKYWHQILSENVQFAANSCLLAGAVVFPLLLV